MKIKTAALIAVVGLSASFSWQLAYPTVTQNLIDSGADYESILRYIYYASVFLHHGSEIILAFALYRASK